jgi:hypothetical protein
MQALLDSLTHSLDLACRGYLCAPLVDCDSKTDPECGPTGKKLQFPEAIRDPVRGLALSDSGFKENLHEDLPRK